MRAGVSRSSTRDLPMRDADNRIDRTMALVELDDHKRGRSGINVQGVVSLYVRQADARRFAV